MNENKRTLKEKRFIDAYIKHQGNLTQAYLELSPGCSLASARVLGYRWLQKVNIPAQELLDRLDLTDVSLVQKLKEGLEAIKTMSGNPVPDYNARAKYLDMALKLKAKYPADRSKFEVTGKDGLPLNPTNTVFLVVRHYENCPLKDTRGCLMEKEVNRLEDLKKEGKKEARKNDRTQYIGIDDDENKEVINGFGL